MQRPSSLQQHSNLGWGEQLGLVFQTVPKDLLCKALDLKSSKSYLRAMHTLQERIKLLEEENRQLRASLGKSEQELLRCRQQGVNERNNSDLSALTLQEEVRALEGCREQLQREKEHSSRQVAELKAVLQLVQDRQRKDSEQMYQMGKARESLQGLNNSLLTELQANRLQMALQSAEIARAQDKVDELGKAVRQLQSKIDSLQQSNRQLTSQNYQLKQQGINASSQIASLSAELERQREDREVLGRKIAEDGLRYQDSASRETTLKTQVADFFKRWQDFGEKEVGRQFGRLEAEVQRCRAGVGERLLAGCGRL